MAAPSVSLSLFSPFTIMIGDSLKEIRFQEGDVKIGLIGQSTITCRFTEPCLEAEAQVINRALHSLYDGFIQPRQRTLKGPNGETLYSLAVATNAKRIASVANPTFLFQPLAPEVLSSATSVIQKEFQEAHLTPDVKNFSTKRPNSRFFSVPEILALHSCTAKTTIDYASFNQDNGTYKHTTVISWKNSSIQIVSLDLPLSLLKMYAESAIAKEIKVEETKMDLPRPAAPAPVEPASISVRG